VQVVEGSEKTPVRARESRRKNARVRKLLGAVAGLVAIAFASDAAAEEKKWQFIMEPYVYMGSLDGNAAIGRAQGDIDADFGDLLKNLKIAAMLNAEATNDRWGAISDFQYLKLGLKRDLAGDRFAELTSKLTVFETEAFYRWHIGERATLDGFAGIRYWNVRLYADLSGPLLDPALRRAADWVDPLIGMRLTVPLTERLTIRVRGDIGGFGVGSKFSWQVFAGLGYDVSRRVAVTLGYRYLDANYSRGLVNTPDHFVYDAAMHGPQLGFRFTF
jgi:opacity protein-like surface antigen